MAMAKFTVSTTSATFDAGSAVDKGGGLVGIPATAHGLSAGDWVSIVGTDNYDDVYQLDDTTTVNELVIAATYVAETFSTTDSANRKLFVAKAGVTTFDVKVDLYSDAKEHWLAGGTVFGFDFPFGMERTGVPPGTVGGDDIDEVAGTTVPLYTFLRDGWRIRPDEANHTLAVTGGILLVAGGGDPFVDTVGAYTVRINYQQPVQVIAQDTGGGGGLTAEQTRAAVWDSAETDPPVVGSYWARIKKLLSRTFWLGAR